MQRVCKEVLWLLAGFLAGLTAAYADEGPSPATDGTPETTTREDHPLEFPRALVQRQIETIRETVRDYSCLLVKRERIDGRLQPYQYIETKVRREVVQDGIIVRPFAVSFEYLGPREIRGRRVFFEEGANDGKMLVQRNRGLLGRVALKISPDSAAARQESLNRITDVGFEQMSIALLDRIEREMQLDPDGTNTIVEYYRNAAVDNRTCTHIKVKHARRQTGLIFHVADFFVDDELQVPIRIATFDWPGRAGDPPPLISEFNYTRLKLNVGLDEADFPPMLDTVVDANGVER